MNNPWTEIGYSDYENHMKEVGQAQALSDLTKYSLEKYQPESFVLLGCTTGNGLEHINSTVTTKVYAIDINADYLQKTRENFGNKIKNLTTLNLDIRISELPFDNIDLFFIGLVLEYVEPESVLDKIIQTLNKNGKLIIVIQKSAKTDFVTKTKYKSLEKLSSISKEVDEVKLNKHIQSREMVLKHRQEIELQHNKSFIFLEYMMKEN